jgi:hypothetical protein
LLAFFIFIVLALVVIFFRGEVLVIFFLFILIFVVNRRYFSRRARSLHLNTWTTSERRQVIASGLRQLCVDEIRGQWCIIGFGWLGFGKVWWKRCVVNRCSLLGGWGCFGSCALWPRGGGWEERLLWRRRRGGGWEERLLWWRCRREGHSLWFFL